MRRLALFLLVAAACAGCGSGSKPRTVTVTTIETLPAAPPPSTTQAPAGSTVVPYFIEGNQVAAGEPVETSESGTAAAALRAVLD